MKRISYVLYLFVTAFALLLSGALDATAETGDQRIMNIVSEYRGCSGFDVIELGSLPMSMVRGAAKVALKVQSSELEEDERRELEIAIGVLKGVRRMAIVDYEDAHQRDKNRFDAKVASALKNHILLMSVNEDDEQVEMYGVANESGTMVTDFVLYVRGEALICLFGNISRDSVMKIVQEESR